MVSTMNSLDSVAQEYLQDNEFHQERNLVSKQREETIPHYKHVLTQFINGTLNLDAFRNELKSLQNKDRFWGAYGPGFLMGINQLASNHVPGNPEIETHFRFILNGLNAQNMGQRIEQFYNLLTKERERLRETKFPLEKLTKPGSSAFIISLLTFWNDYTNKPYIYYPSLRLGLAALLNSKLIPASSDILMDSSGVRIISDTDHQAVAQTLDNLGNVVPQLKKDAYWAERFMIWLTDKIKENPAYLKNTTFILGETENEPEGESSGSAEPAVPSYIPLDDKELVATPEPLLTQLIKQLRHHILVEEDVARQIYYALLNGHVIFTGPPGTGKTELARLIPELLWQSQDIAEITTQAVEDNTTSTEQPTQITPTAYTATLVTATNEWSTRTLISSIAPMVNADKVAYRTQYGHLAQAILRNWAYTIEGPGQWTFQGRKSILAASCLKGKQEQEFRGHWLIIDEFNRAPIDTALGEALTTLSDGEALLVPVDGTTVKLPLPKDFRIIGTLNSFDRNYLNKISEALKRRFAFIEILPPTRAARTAEQGIVLYKALKKLAHLSSDIMIDGNIVEWRDVVLIAPDKAGVYTSEWYAETHPFYELFYTVIWPLFEVVRIYRQLGTAQAIALLQHILTPCLLEHYTTKEQWLHVLDRAFCEVIADQLQVLLPDELEVLIWYLKYDADTFIEKYNGFLGRLAGKQRRLVAHLEALGTLVDEHGKALLTDEDIEQLLEDEEPQLAREPLIEAFRLEHEPARLPKLSRRLRAFKAERGL